MTDILHSEIGSYPADWSIQRVDSLFDIQQGKSVSKAHREGDNQKPFLRTKNVFWGKIDFSELDQMHFTAQEEARLKLQAGDLLLCEGGDVGRASIWNDQMEGCYYQNHLHRLRAKAVNEVDPQFALYWFWYAFKVANIYIGRSNVTTIPNLSQSKLSELQIPKPEFDEQRRIAHVLTSVQTAIEQQARLIALTRELKSALMRKLFTEGLHGEKQKETEIGLVPESWELHSIDDMFEIKQGKQLSAKTRIGDNQKPFLRTANVFWGRIDLSKLDFMHFTSEEERKLTLQEGDLLVCEGGDIGRTALWHGEMAECYYQNHLHRLRRKNDKTVPSFMQYWMMYAVVQRKLYVGHGNKTTIPNLSKAKLGQCLIPNPPTNEEQISVAHTLEAIDRKITITQSRKSKLEELFRTLLHQLMTVQVRVNYMEIDTNEVLK